MYVANHHHHGPQLLHNGKCILYDTNHVTHQYKLSKSDQPDCTLLISIYNCFVLECPQSHMIFIYQDLFQKSSKNAKFIQCLHQEPAFVMSRNDAQKDTGPFSFVSLFFLVCIHCEPPLLTSTNMGFSMANLHAMLKISSFI